LWGTARGAHAALIRELGATPIDCQHEDFTRVLPGEYDVVFDGIGEDGYRRSFAALKLGGLLCAYGYTASVQARHRLVTILMWIARVYLWRRLLPGGKRLRIYSINLMRALHPAWFREDLERLFGLLETGDIRPRVAERISFDEGRRGTPPPSRGGRSRGQARSAPGAPAATRLGAALARAGPTSAQPHPRPELSRGVS